jgi:hypothetical protein
MHGEREAVKRAKETKYLYISRSLQNKQRQQPKKEEEKVFYIQQKR